LRILDDAIVSNELGQRVGLVALVEAVRTVSVFALSVPLKLPSAILVSIIFIVPRACSDSLLFNSVQKIWLVR